MVVVFVYGKDNFAEHAQVMNGFSICKHMHARCNGNHCVEIITVVRGIHVCSNRSVFKLCKCDKIKEIVARKERVK